jgi:predicted restriction endonuclease
MRHYPPRRVARPGQTHRSPGRDSWKQDQFRRAVLARDGHACRWLDGAGRRCGVTTDLRACHIVPFAETGGYDVDNGITLCRTHDMATDRYAR